METAPAAMTAAQRARLEAALADEDVGLFRRKAIRRRLAGVVAIGPFRVAPEPAPEPTKADEIRATRRLGQIELEHRKIVEAEIDAVDQHADDVVRRIEVLESTSAGSFSLQELKAEAGQLRELKSMLADDLSRGPITHFPDGREVDDRMRRIIAARGRELAESRWASANRHAAAGDHREARLLRRDALRSRMIAEHEIGLRPSLPGFGLARWD